MGKYLENWSKKMVQHKAKIQNDRIIEENGKIYIFFNRRGYGGTHSYDTKPIVCNDWEEAGEYFNIF